MSLQGNIKLRKVSYLQLLFTNFKDKTKSLQEINKNLNYFKDIKFKIAFRFFLKNINLLINF